MGQRLRLVNQENDEVVNVIVGRMDLTQVCLDRNVWQREPSLPAGGLWEGTQFQDRECEDLDR